VLTWTPSTVDFILHQGDDIYRSVPHQQEYFDYTELPLSVAVDNWSANVTFGDHMSGFLHCSNSTTTAFSFPDAVRQAFRTHNGCLLTANSTTIAIIAQNGCLFVFDSHSRDSRGFLSPNGTAVLLQFTSVERLYRHLQQLYNLPSNAAIAATCLLTLGLKHDSRCQFDVMPVDVQTELKLNADNE